MRPKLGKQVSTLRSANKPLALFIALNLADFCATASIISLGGKEVMPIARGFLDFYGLPGLFVHKLFIASGVGYLCRDFTERWWNLLNNLFAAIVVWNTTQLCLFTYAVIGSSSI